MGSADGSIHSAIATTKVIKNVLTRSLFNQKYVVVFSENVTFLSLILFSGINLQDADQVERLNETGELRQLLKQYKVCVKEIYSKNHTTRVCVF